MAIYTSSDLLAETARNAGIKLQVGSELIDPASTPARVVLVRIWNSGDFPIKADDIDKEEPFGFRLNAAVLQLDVVHASTGYLKRGVPIARQGTGEVLLRRVTLEPGESLIVRALIRRQDKEQDDLEPFGKIAGLPEITKRITNWDPSGFWVRSYPTPMQDQVKRWGIGTLLLALVLLAAGMSIRNWLVKRQSTELQQDRLE